MQKNNKKIKKFALICIILMNIYTLNYVAPLKENLSYLGNELQHKTYLIIWGCSASIYFYYYTKVLMNRNKYDNVLGRLCLIFACACMMLSVILPYDPQQVPVLSKWHIRIAMTGTVMYVLVFFHLLYDIMKNNFSLYEKAMPLYSMLVAFDLMLFMVYGSVTTLLEITFTIGMAALLFYMDQRSLKTLDEVI